MQLLFKNVRVIHPESSHHGEIVDIFIKNGKIESLGSQTKAPKAKEIALDGACVSPGWLDLGVHTGDPGFEHREDMASITGAAAAGGFTGIATQPNTSPVVHSKSEILYLRNSTKSNIVDFFPIGALSYNCEGKEITEMYDMHRAGAVAFSDGAIPVQNSGLMLRGLQYVKAFDGVVINHPHDKTLVPGGQMHEGRISTSLGMKGIPTLAEELMLQRDIYLTAYTDSRLHVAHVSTLRGVQLIRQAKSKGLDLTASVAAINLAFTDKDLVSFDHNLKVLPPLRLAQDRRALKEGLKDGTIDVICSNHVPVDEEAKNREFYYADFGVIGLETTFAVSRTYLKGILNIDQLIEKLAIKPRQILGLPIPDISPGAPANLTFFNPDQEWAYELKDIRSKSRNSPFIGTTLTGKVFGIVNNGFYSGL